MTRQEFKIWLVTNGYNQKELATKLELHENTIGGYVKKGSFPLTFQMALELLALKAKAAE